MIRSEKLRGLGERCDEAATRAHAAGREPGEAPRWNGGRNGTLEDHEAAVEAYVAKCDGKWPKLKSFKETATYGNGLCQAAQARAKAAGRQVAEPPVFNFRQYSVPQFKAAVEEYVAECEGKAVAAATIKATFFAHDPRLARLTKAGAIDDKAEHPLSVAELKAVCSHVALPIWRQKIAEHYSYSVRVEGGPSTTVLKEYPGPVPDYLAGEVQKAAAGPSLRLPTRVASLRPPQV
jgi:hypothetical protein